MKRVAALAALVVLGVPRVALADGVATPRLEYAAPTGTTTLVFLACGVFVAGMALLGWRGLRRLATERTRSEDAPAENAEDTCTT